MKTPKETRLTVSAVLPRPTAAGQATAYSPLTGVSDTHPFFHLIGRVSAEWAQFEHVLDLVIWSLVGLDHAVVACVTAQVVGAQSRCNAIIALTMQRGLPSRLIKECRELSNKVHKPQTARNRIVHDAWFVVPGTKTVARYKKMARDEWIYGVEPVTGAQIQQTITDIKELHARAALLLTNVLAVLAPLPGKDSS